MTKVTEEKSDKKVPSPIVTNSYQETSELGFRLGKLLQPGDLVCINGDLGTGKTALTGGIARALGITSYITSPTFTLVNEYEGSIPLYHFDVYRIGDPAEMFETGIEEYLAGNGIVVIEWAELVSEILPVECINIHIEKNPASGVDVREIEIEFRGRKYVRREELFGYESACG